MKRCNKCKKWKDETEFYKDRKNKFGLRGSCKACDKKQTEEYNQRPEVIAKKKEYYQRPEVIAKKKEYYQRPETKAKQKVYNKVYVHLPEVKARKNEYNREWRQRPDVKEKARKKYKQRPEVKAKAKERRMRRDGAEARRKIYQKKYQKIYQQNYNKKYRTDPDFRARELVMSLEYGKKATESLEVSYLNKKLKRDGFTSDTITEDILDMKREQILLFREIKKVKEVLRNGIT